MKTEGGMGARIGIEHELLMDRIVAYTAMQGECLPNLTLYK